MCGRRGKRKERKGGPNCRLGGEMLGRLLTRSSREEKEKARLVSLVLFSLKDERKGERGVFVGEKPT